MEITKSILRKPDNDDIPALRDMWLYIFGEEGLSSFFSHFYSADYAIVAEADGTLAAMGYIVPMGELLCGDIAQPCAMLYAIATLPGHRNMGLGAAVTLELIKTACKLGYPVAVLHPSENHLFDYYSRHTILKNWFFADDRRISAASTGKLRIRAGEMPGSPAFNLQSVSPAEYSTLRENLLEGTIHIRHTTGYIEYQKLLCDETGGGLYRIGNSCAVAEIQRSGAVWVKELLLSENDNERDVICAINNEYPSHEYIYRFPAKNGSCRKGCRFGMLAAQENITAGINAEGTLPWYGLAFE